MRERLLAAERVKALEWREGVLHVRDQRLLPAREAWLALDSAGAVAEAIRDGAVRGAAAIGIAAAYGLVLGARARLAAGGDWQAALEADFQLLREAQPAAAGLRWALECLRNRLRRLSPGADPLTALEAEAGAILASDREANLAIAQFGLELLRQHDEGIRAVLTHGNAGALAGGGFGSALGVIRAGWLGELVEQVYVGESRPGLEGARLTAWELHGDGVPTTVCVDAAAGHLMKSERIGWLIVGAERIAANGDVAATIGTYPLTVLAMHHGLRVMVAAPSSCIDMGLEHGEDIPLEDRAASEVLDPAVGVEVFNPAFDVTPADLIDVIVTERGVIERPDAAKLAELLCRKRLH